VAAVAVLLGSAAVLLLVGLPGTALRGLYGDVDHALAARTMATSGEWVTPHGPDTAPPPAPPLSTWAAGAFYRLTGAHGELPARLPSVLGALALVLGTAHLGWRLRGLRTGVRAGLILLTMHLLLAMARQPFSDAVMLASLGVVLVALAELLSSSPRPAPADPDRSPPAPGARAAGWWLVLAVGVVGATLVAGPVLLPLAVLMLAPSWFGAGRVRPTGRQALLMLAVAVVLLAPWPAAVLTSAPQAAAAWRAELLGGPGGDALSTSSWRPWWFSGPHLVNTAPWLLLWPLGLAWAWQRRRGDRLAPLLLWWAAGGLLLFSFIPTGRQAHDLLPLYPALALLVADLWGGWERSRAVVTAQLAADGHGSLPHHDVAARDRARRFPARIFLLVRLATGLVVVLLVLALAVLAVWGEMPWPWPLAAAAVFAGGWWFKLHGGWLARVRGGRVSTAPVRWLLSVRPALLRLPGINTLAATAAVCLLAYHAELVPRINAYASGRAFWAEARAAMAGRGDQRATGGEGGEVGQGGEGGQGGEVDGTESGRRLPLAVSDVHLAMAAFYLRTRDFAHLQPGVLADRALAGRAGWLITGPDLAPTVPGLHTVLERTFTAPVTGQERGLGLYRFDPALARVQVEARDRGRALPPVDLPQRPGPRQEE